MIPRIFHFLVVLQLIYLVLWSDPALAQRVKGDRGTTTRRPVDGVPILPEVQQQRLTQEDIAVDKGGTDKGENKKGETNKGGNEKGDNKKGENNKDGNDGGGLVSFLELIGLDATIVQAIVEALLSLFA